MRTINMLLAAAVTSTAAFGLAAPGMAQPSAPSVQRDSPAVVHARERETNRLLMEALVKRRAQLALEGGGTQAQRAALDFLEQRILEMRRRIGD
jgi:hypothetical protein